jgi:SRSO17 transposase
MVEPRLPQSTVRFVDNYCRAYRHLFSDVRSFEAFTSLHLGLIAPLARKSLPAIAKAVGLPNDQVLHHFLTHSPWQVEAVRYQRLSLILEQIRGQPIVLVLDDTGDRKKGKMTDYVDRQYIGNVGKVDNGMVSVNAYGVLGDLTFPLLFKVFKPRGRLKAEDVYHTKLQLAQQIIQELLAFGFHFSLVLADSFYGESHPFLDVLDQLKLPWIMAIRSNHGVWMPKEAEVSYSAWQAFERVFARGETETRYIQEIIFGRRFEWRYWTLTNNPTLLPANSTWMVMSHLSPEPDQAEFIGNLYGLRTWIEYGFKQCKNELGWADYRLTHYEQIERWWEIVSSVYLMVSLQFYGLGAQPPGILDEGQRDLLTRLEQHPDWQEAKGWKRRFNNVQLLVQPFIFFCLLQPWMRLFDVSTLERGFTKLIRIVNSFPGWSPLAPSAPIQHFSSA